MITIQEARKYLKRDVSDERVTQILGYLHGMAETIIRQERKKYEQNFKRKLVK